MNQKSSWPLFAALFVGVVLSLGGAAAVTVWHLSDRVDKLSAEIGEKLYDSLDPEAQISVLDRDGQDIGYRGNGAVDFVPYEDIPQVVVNALVAAEDEGFFDHYGISFSGMARAAWENLKAGGVVQGGSTITQQLAKMVFLSGEQTLDRKLNELLLAMALEKRLSKPQILELYLNRAFFGYHSYGIANAASNFFGLKLSELKPEQAALLVGLLKAPSTLQPYINPDGAKRRRNYVLGRMLDAGFIGVEEYQTSLAADIGLRSGARNASKRDGYLVEAVLQRLTDLMGIDPGRERVGLRIQSTLDRALQQRLAKLSADIAEDVAKSSALSVDELFVGGLLVEAETGAVAAYVGGLNFHQRQFNAAMQTQRQIGRLILPFVYAYGYDLGVSPFIGRFGGEPSHWQDSLAAALAQQSYAEGLAMAAELGLGGLASKLALVGWPQFSVEGRLPLGKVSANLWQVASSYTCLANQGLCHRPYLIKTLMDHNGREIYRNSARQLRKGLNHDAATAVNFSLTALATKDRAPILIEQFEQHHAFVVSYVPGYVLAMLITNDRGRYPLFRSDSTKALRARWREKTDQFWQGVKAKTFADDERFSALKYELHQIGKRSRIGAKKPEILRY